MPKKNKAMKGLQSKIVSKNMSPTYVLLLLLLGAALWGLAKLYPDYVPPIGELADDRNTHISAEGKLAVHFIDVGQGDAALVMAPSGESLLIDAGPNASADELTAYLEAQGVKKLTYAVFSHSHEDHIGGADEVLAEFSAETVILSGGVEDTATYERMLDAVDACGAAVEFAEAGQSFTLGDASFRILGPLGDEYDDANNWSVVLRVDYGGTSFLFAGDAEQKVEEELLWKYDRYALGSTVFKASHHGSSTSNSLKFLRAVNPEIVVISLGEDNTYGHPHAGPLKNFAAVGAEILRTDELGSIVLASDGSTVSNLTRNPK